MTSNIGRDLNSNLFCMDWGAEMNWWRFVSWWQASLFKSIRGKLKRDSFQRLYARIYSESIYLPCCLLFCACNSKIFAGLCAQVFYRFIGAITNPIFCSIKWLGALLPWMGCWSIAGYLPSYYGYPFLGHYESLTFWCRSLRLFLSWNVIFLRRNAS
jgi:hypothetical protein